MIIDAIKGTATSQRPLIRPPVSCPFSKRVPQNTLTMNLLLNIGGLHLLIAGTPWTDATVPLNFRPFVCSGTNVPASAATLSIETPDSLPDAPAGRPLSVSYNDLGKASLHDAGTEWCVALTPCPGQYPRLMHIDKGLRRAVIGLRADDSYADFVIDSMSRIFFSQFAASCGAIMVHASVVGCDSRAFLFMGKSGTGKSTHSRLWTETFTGCTLLNDDCPLITADDRGILVHGTPWSGKTPCWRKASLPLGGIARLRQAPVNRFTPLSGIEAFVAFIPGMSVMTSDKNLYSAASSTALTILDLTNTGILECLPDSDAAVTCRKALDKKY